MKTEEPKEIIDTPEPKIDLRIGVNVLDVSDISHVLLIRRGSENESCLREFLKRYSMPERPFGDARTLAGLRFTKKEAREICADIMARATKPDA
jgi:hypothetical protein